MTLTTKLFVETISANGIASHSESLAINARDKDHLGGQFSESEVSLMVDGWSGLVHHSDNDSRSH